MDYFSIISYGFAELFNIVGQIKIGDISYLNLCLIVLIIALIWRFVLQPIFVPSGLSINIEKVKNVDVKKGKGKK